VTIGVLGGEEFLALRRAAPLRKLLPIQYGGFLGMGDQPLVVFSGVVPCDLSADRRFQQQLKRAMGCKYAP